VPDTIPTSDSIAVVRESFHLDLPINLSSMGDEDATAGKRGLLPRLQVFMCPNLSSPLGRSKTVVPTVLAQRQGFDGVSKSRIYIRH
jgi:hypothetical protein